MASLTVRQLDDKLKRLLRLRAARNGRSMEDEVRIILRQAATETAREALNLINPSNPPAEGEAPHETVAPPSRPIVRTEPLRHTPRATTAAQRRVLLIVGGGIAAYKSLDLIRRLQDHGIHVRCILTAAAQHFITPLAAGALCGAHVHTDLFDPKSEFDVGHIRLARDTDLIVVAPATADLMAKMAGGHADDLASAVLLATDRPVLIAPAMNPHMWSASATKRNLAQLTADGVRIVGPNAGEMAEHGEAGIGRMAEPLEIVAAAEPLLRKPGPLTGKRVLVTSGPTSEPIDPVRFIANRSSGKQGHAIATAAAAAGADVVLISGPVNLPNPPGVTVIKIETARQMLEAVEKALPADVAIFAAAVADWRSERESDSKIKKQQGQTPMLRLVENPDILSTVAHRKTGRPRLVIGFAAETDDLIANAEAKLAKKGCDWILANDVSPETGIMGGDANTIHLISSDGVEDWPPQSKDNVARMLVERITKELDAELAAPPEGRKR
ncbi:MAG TPA: bifunctional phosphopantothenoylcysteine decarboxylase/phosphopantothenate--cysteine ligase CoaBC [Xanthobacteraceae bacterium]|jgi:phosphopantothenoylcysteine decarboxylase/phosphopantothenate--cysteine ligase|nr:bifunctional phosphopantothenoylcysteine decarboxylase/phosphopantothenate--cysteine ligase CoaBC [Xanthobacteraceae bacterium]